MKHIQISKSDKKYLNLRNSYTLGDHMFRMGGKKIETLDIILVLKVTVRSCLYLSLFGKVYISIRGIIVE